MVFQHCLKAKSCFQPLLENECVCALCWCQIGQRGKKFKQGFIYLSLKDLKILEILFLFEADLIAYCFGIFAMEPSFKKNSIKNLMDIVYFYYKLGIISCYWRKIKFHGKRWKFLSLL